MPHPIMFADDDHGLAEVRRIALGFPDAFEKVSHGRPAFAVTKVFTWYGGSSKETGHRVLYPYSVLVKPSEDERPALEKDTRFFFPMYLGPAGWLGLDLAAAQVDWDEVTELIDTSFRLVAPKKLIKQLDDRTHGGS
ncbi:MAG: MmcQ/YjbR family DNA-binding protein [Mycobacterium sp.]